MSSARAQCPDWVDRFAGRIAPGGSVQIIETHISWVLLTGDIAYKIKKPLELGFLDFSTPEKRHHACLEEVRLNRRLAPDVYLDVVAITGSPEAPELGGPGEAFDYAVKMRQFPPESTLDRLADAGRLTVDQVEAFASRIGWFHAEGCARAGPDDGWGDSTHVWTPVAQNFAQIASLIETPEARALLDRLSAWSTSAHARLAPLMDERKRDGFVRECHGDLHLGNLAWVDEAPLVFDCLEFNPELRWIDIVSDAAFCYMDLIQRGHPDWAWLFLNVWVEVTGDHAGLALLRYYAVYRALVRAKVAGLRAAQTSGPEREAARDTLAAQLRLAHTLALSPPACLEITHGLSGSGKSTATWRLMQSPGAIRLRSDVERKRMAGLDAQTRSSADVGRALYAVETTRQTYGHLAELAGKLLDAGWPVIVDATFLAHWQRDLFRKLAHARGTPFRILDFRAPVEALRARIVARARRGGDPSEATLEVLDHQMANEEPLREDELAECFEIDTSGSPGEIGGSV